MKPAFHAIRDIVLIGGGHSHVFVLRNFGMKPIRGARLTLISPEVDTPYSGMLPGLIAGHYTFDEAHIDLEPLAGFARARYLRTSVIRVDPENRLVHCADGRPPIRYDVLSINTGSTPVMPRSVAFERDVLPVKPVAAFLKGWASLREHVSETPARRIGIVGGGAGGVELALSIQVALRAMLRGLRRSEGEPAIHVFTRDPEILKTHNAGVRKAFREIMVERGIAVHTGFDVDRVDDAGVHGGERLVALDDVIWVTGASPAPWIKQSGFDVDGRGFLKVDEILRSTSHPDVFGAGDAATIVGAPRPKSGVFAVRAGRPLIANLRGTLLGEGLVRHDPQRKFLSLISTGDKYAVASRGGWSARGAWVWNWKDWIDRAFMTKFRDLPEMDEFAPDALPVVADVPEEVAESQRAGAMRCAGCGAKIGPKTLSEVLEQITPRTGDGVVMGLQSRDDAAVFTVPEGKLLVQSVDNFPAMVDDPYVFGQIAANHSLGDLYAMGAIPHSALAIASVPFGLPEKTADTLVQMLSGALQVLEGAGCALIGGHTSEGAELALGFTVNGFADSGQITGKGRLLAGQALILTKPIGSGVVFAGGQRRQAKGRWVAAAIENALVSSRAAGEILRSFGATAMTDVTGFGLAGHLGEMIEASHVGAEIDIPSVPLLAGAAELSAGGVASSLLGANMARRLDIRIDDARRGSSDLALLFDPQTAGGLLAGVPEARAAACVVALKEAGYYKACIIGRTVSSEPGTGATLSIR